MAKRNPDTITLGSGELFTMEYDGTLPEIEKLCVSDNRLGWIKGGATLTYSAETYEEKDDLGKVHKIITTSETVTLKAGVLTWNGETLAKLAATGRVTTSDGKRILKVGGLANDNRKNYVICFKHSDPVDGNVYVLIVGKNTAGFALAYSTGAGTQIDPEFTAYPQDDDGTLVQLIEETA